MDINTVLYIASGIVTYILGKINKYFKLNKSLPIEIQNVLIIAISSLFIYIQKNNTNNYISILNNILNIVGGVSSSVLIYDVQKKIYKK